MELKNSYNDLKNHLQNNTSLEFSKLNINSFIKEIEKKIDKLNQVLVVDRIEEKFAVCENRNTKEIVNINLKFLPFDVKEGMVLKYINGKYKIDEKNQIKIEERIKNKMNKLWN